MRLEMYRGRTAVFEFECKKADGSPLPLSTGTLWFTVKSSTRQSDVDAILQKSSASGITIVDASLGTAKVTISPIDTAGEYAPAELEWDLTYNPVTGQSFTLLDGKLFLRANVTNTTVV